MDRTCQRGSQKRADMARNRGYLAVLQSSVWRQRLPQPVRQHTMARMPAATARKRASLAAALILSALLAAGAALWLRPGEQPVAPAIELTLLDGTRQPLERLRGRPVLLAFWSLTCAPCLEELPELIRFHDQWRPRGLEMIAVAMPYDPPLHVQTFARERRVPYPIALDVTGEAARAFGVAQVPMAFVVSPEGRIVYRQLGKLDIVRAAQLIESLLPAGSR
jgi:peroxiredoxin